MIKMTELKTGQLLIAHMRGLGKDTIKLKQIMLVRPTDKGVGMVAYPPFIADPEMEIPYPKDHLLIPPYDPEPEAIAFYKKRLEEERQRRSGIEIAQTIPSMN